MNLSARHTYYKIGGPADVVAVPKDLDDFKILADGIHATRLSTADVFILGSGSNLLVSDAGFRGLVVKAIRANIDISVVSGDRIRTGAGVAVSTLLRRAAHEGWDGLEFLGGIPGSIGGVVAMNAGTHLGEAKDALLRVEAFALTGSGGLLSFEDDAIQCEYRHNLFLPECSVVWAAEWRIRPADPSEVKRKIDEILARRKASQPVEYPSCGSVFKNPRASGLHAWQVIDRLGLRGHRIGGAQFSEKHCNFIINHGGATAADVRALVELAKTRASEELGVAIEEEVRYVGDITG